MSRPWAPKGRTPSALGRQPCCFSGGAPSRIVLDRQTRGSSLEPEGRQDVARAVSPGAPRGRTPSAHSGQAKGSSVLSLLVCLTLLATTVHAAPKIPTAAEVEQEFSALCRNTMQGPNPYYGHQNFQRLRATLERPNPSQTPEQRLQLQRLMAKELLKIGKNSDSAQLFAQTLQESAQRQMEVPFQLQLLTELGIAYMRMGEIRNCLDLHTAGMCIMPIAPEGQHKDPEAMREALRAFLSVLGGVDHPSVRWLANIAAMTVGAFPEGLPPEVRLPMDRLTSPQDIGRFRDVTHEAGISIVANSGGAIADDFDGDHRFDIVTSSQHPCVPLRYYRNDGNGRFTDHTEAAGLDIQLGGLNVLHADVDNDGDPDLLVLRGGWFGEHGKLRNSLLRNNGPGPDGVITFTDITAAAGLATPAYPTQTGAWADIDHDGDLDLYIGNEANAENLIDPSNLGEVQDAYPSQLFRNNGPGPGGVVTFTDIAAAAGVTNQRFTKGVAWGDYDNDGDADLYVSNIGPNRLYRNDGPAPPGTSTPGVVRFTDVASTLGVTAPDSLSFTTWWFDLDNDEDLDLFVADYGSSPLDIAAHYLGKDIPGGNPLIYRNDGGRFTEVGRAMGLTVPTLPMGGNFGDLDNDGFLDFYLGTGLPPFEALMPNLMYRNDGGRRFVDVTYSGGFGHLQKGHGVAFADFDRDGDQDVFEEMGGAVPGDVYHSILYANPGHGHAWIGLDLQGVRSNRAGLGARITAEVSGGAGATRRVHRVAGTGGSFGGNPLEQHLGLGRLGPGQTVKLRVHWPTSDTTQTFENVAPGRVYALREGTDTLNPKSLETFSIGGARGETHHESQ